MGWTKDHGTIAKVNADYAKVQGDVAKQEAANLAKLKTDAEGATANATTAATNANTATQNANTAKTNADNAASEAITQANHAKNEGDRAKAEADRLVGTDVSVLDNKIGSLSSLNTTNKISVVESVNEVTTQLAQKANELETKKADISFVNQQVQVTQNSWKSSYATLTDLQTAYPNGDSNKYAVVSDGFIYSFVSGAWKNTNIVASGINVPNQSITIDKTDFIKKVGSGFVDTNVNNLFVTTGALNPSTGAVSTTATTSLVSDFIDLTNVEFIFRYINDGLSDVTNTAHTIGFFDANKTFISSVANINSAPNSFHNGKYGYKYTNFPVNAKFARINVTKIVFEGSPTTKYNFLKVSKVLYNQLENDANTKSIEIVNDQIASLNQKVYSHQGKKIAVFGDSIMEFGNIPETIAQLTGATVYDCSVGGTRLARHSANTQGALYNEMSMFRLAKYINSGDYTVLTQAVDSLKTTYNDDNTVNMNTLKSLDWSLVDIIVISFGTNDYHGNGDAVKIGTDSDITSDGSTFKGALNYAIDQLLSKYPNLQIVFTTPIYRHRFSSAGDGLNSDVYANDKGLYLKDYSNAIKEVASLNHLPVIDLYSISGINKYTHKKFLNSDELHPSTSGYSLIGIKIAKYL